MTNEAEKAMLIWAASAALFNQAVTISQERIAAGKRIVKLKATIAERAASNDT